MTTTCCSITGNPIFNDNSICYGPVIGNPSFNDTSLDRRTNIFDNITGEKASSVQWYENNVPVVSTNSSTYQINSNTLTVSTSAYEIKSLIPAEITIYNNQSVLISPISINSCATIIGSPIFNDNTKNYGRIIGTATFNQSAENGIPFNNILCINNTSSSVVLNVGDSLSFNVDVTTQDTLSVQWYKNDVPIVSSNSLTYNVSSVSNSDSGSYTVVISTSSYEIKNIVPSVVTINSGLGFVNSVTISPDSVVVPVSSYFILNSTISGTGAMQYQWYRNGLPISNASENSYGTNPLNYLNGDAYLEHTLKYGHTGKYQLVVQTDTNTLTSNVASVLVQPASAGVAVAATIGNQYYLRNAGVYNMQTLALNEVFVHNDSATSAPAEHTFLWQYTTSSSTSNATLYDTNGVAMTGRNLVVSDIDQSTLNYFVNFTSGPYGTVYLRRKTCRPDGSTSFNYLISFKDTISARYPSLSY